VNIENSEQFWTIKPDDDLGDAIADLAPDVSWADDLRTPTPAEIRERVSNFTPEQRAAAERDAVRAELGDTALALAKQLMARGKLDDAEQWLTVAEEHAVPHARELLDELSVLRRAMPENAPDDVFTGTDVTDCITAEAMQQAAEILEKARSESTELVDSALVKVKQILDRARVSAAEIGLSRILDDLVRVDSGGRHGRPTLLWLLWLLLDWSGLPIAKPLHNEAKLSTVRVQRGTVLANLLSPADTRTSVGGPTGFPFRVLLLPKPDQSACTGTMQPGSHRINIAMTDLRHLDWTQWSTLERCRLLVVLPTPPIRANPGEPENDLLVALVEHLLPGHGLSPEQVKHLSWESILDRLARDDGETKRCLLSVCEAILNDNKCIGNLVAVVMNGEIGLRWWCGDKPTKETPGKKEDRRGTSGKQRGLSQPRHRQILPNATNKQTGKHCCDLPVQAEAGDSKPTVDQHPSKQRNIKDAHAMPETRTVSDALHALDASSEEYLVFTDAESGHPTVVYRRPGAGHSVMRLGEMEPTSLESVGREAMQLLADTQKKIYDEPPAAAPAETKLSSGESSTHAAASGQSDEFDDFLIIECEPQPL
jgi:hypothetical protein